MEKVAFKMKLNPGMVAEYKKRHDQISPELVSLLRANGITDYSIFYDPDNDTLFATLIPTNPVYNEKLKENPLMKQWWEYLADIMETNPDNSPVVIPLQEVFHMA